MWVFFIPFAIVALLALIAAGFFFARRGVARGGPHPDDMRGIPE